MDLNIGNLQNLIKAFEAEPPTIEIGIFNHELAQIGSYHEFGTVKMPKRSFLRMPLQRYLPEVIEQNSGEFTDEVLQEIMEGSSVMPWAQIVGDLAYQTVMDAFATEGFGNWKKLAPSTLSRKQNDQILVETGAMRDAIEVKIS